MEREGDNGRKLSFSYDIEGEKLRLIDVSNEDDFLIDSTVFDSLEDLRLSDVQEHKDFKLLGPQTSLQFEDTSQILLREEQNLMPSDAMEPARPSYLRRSLAWDSAFFTNAGVLDPDELTFINEGFKVDMRIRRCEAKSTIKGKDFSSASRKIEIDAPNKIKAKTDPKRQSIKNQRSGKTNVKHISGGEESQLLTCKPPKASDGMRNLAQGQSKSTSLDAYDVKIEIKTATGSGKFARLFKKPELGSSCGSLPSGNLSSPKFSSVLSASTKDRTASLASYDISPSFSPPTVPSALVKRKAKSRKSKLCVSASTSKTPLELLKKSKELGNSRFTAPSKSISSKFSCTPSSSSDASFSGTTSKSKQQSYDLELYLHTPGTLKWTGLQKDSIQGSDPPYVSRRKSSLSLQCEEIKSPAQLNTQAAMGTCPTTTESRKKFKPSGLRQPSPKIGFFDEDKIMVPRDRGGLQFQYDMQSTPPSVDGSRKTPGRLLLPAKISPGIDSVKHGSQGSHLLHPAKGIKHRVVSSNAKIRSSSSKVSSTMKKWSGVSPRFHSHNFGETEAAICSKSRKVDPGECDKKRVGQNSCLKVDDRRMVKGRLKERLRRANEGQKDDISITREHTNPSEIEKDVRQLYFVDNLHSINEHKTKSSTKTEDQVNDLSRYFEVIDLSRDPLMGLQGETNYPCLQCGNSDMENHFDPITSCQQRDLLKISPKPSQLSFSVTDCLTSSRTPLADKSSICNTSGSFELSQESTKAKSVAKVSALFSLEVTDKENI